MALYYKSAAHSGPPTKANPHFYHIFYYLNTSYFFNLLPMCVDVCLYACFPRPVCAKFLYTAAYEQTLRLSLPPEGIG